MNRLTILVLALVAILYIKANSQDANVIPFTSIDPSNNGFDDLEFLKSEIGNKQIVLIGEQDHAAGASIDAKARICNYLIKELGFNVILFESGFYDVNRTIQFDKINDSDKFKNSLYFFWSKNRNIAKFLNGIGDMAKKDKVQIEGFDPKFTSYIASKFYLSDLEQILKKINYSHPSKLEWETFKNLIQKASLNFDKSLVKFNDGERELLNKVSSEICYALNSADETYWFNLVQNNTQMLIAYSKLKLKDFIMVNDKSQELNSIRDSLMAENVKYLIKDKYIGQKIIVWTANYHIIQSPRTISSTSNHFIKDKKIMGDIIAETYGDKIYSIGTISYKGEYGISFNKNKGKKLKPHPDNSIEKYLNNLQNPFCFIKLKENNWIKNKSAMIIGFNNSFQSSDWSKNFDALIYIDNMYPNYLLK